MSKESRKKAMNLLMKQDRTEAQLREKLMQSGFEAEDTEDAITYVKEFHYLDDERFARNYVRYGSENKSRQKLRLALIQKGIASHIIDMVMDEEYQGNEEAQICSFLKKKSFCVGSATEAERQKMIASLYRKGFRINDIKNVMGKMDEFFLND